jgi:16S rRNA (cytosine1402-N4)-methyltransferase
MIAIADEKQMSEEQQPGESSFHLPVLLQQTISLLRPSLGKLFLDGTVGGGGHALALVEAGASVIGCDQDPEAVTEAARRLKSFPDRVRLLEANFAEIIDKLADLNVSGFDGILLDLGVSSHQLHTPSRGFSFLGDGPLDMRMGPHVQRTAADILNEASQEELAKIFIQFGEESAGRRLASRIAKTRVQTPFRRTLDLVKVIESVVPKRGPRHPATKAFQALRIAVNSELDNLELGLRRLSAYVKKGGRMAVITFHSLEDRIVKHYFREVSQAWIDRPEWSAPRRNPAHAFRLVTARPIEPGEEELERNSRARSAKLRVIERISHDS